MWRWQSYNYALRRVVLGHRLPKQEFGTGRWLFPSPADPNTEWFNADMVRVAERYFRERFSIPPRYLRSPDAHPNEVRPNWRKIRAPDLTEAERALAMPSIAKMAETARRNIAAMAARSRQSFGQGARIGDDAETPPTDPNLWADAPAREREAAEWRQQFAEERGFKSFAEVMRYGIAHAARMEPGERPQHNAAGVPQRPPAKEIAPPKGFETAKMTPELYDDLMRRLGGEL